MLPRVSPRTDIPCFHVSKISVTLWQELRWILNRWSLCLVSVCALRLVGGWRGTSGLVRWWWDKNVLPNNSKCPFVVVIYGDIQKKKRKQQMNLNLHKLNIVCKVQGRVYRLNYRCWWISKHNLGLRITYTNLLTKINDLAKS